VPFLFENYCLDADRRELKRSSELIAIGPKVFDLLLFLVENREQVVTRDDLLQAVWGGRIVSESTLTSHINAVRKAIGDTGKEQRLIRTVSRRGLRFIGKIEAQALPASIPVAAPDIAVEKSTGNVTLLFNQPADFSLGTLFAVGWGMAVRHQLFNRTTDDKAALLAAVCYSGAYSKDINLAQGDKTHTFILSPPDLDEASSAMLTLVGQDRAYSARGTSGLDRIQAFVKGYNGGLSAC